MNKRQIILVLITLLFTANVLQAADKSKHPHMGSVQPPAKFELLRQLAGKWEGISHSPEGEKKAAVEYQLSSAGTVLLERLNPGQPDEMLSLYHGDGENLLMTHYCALGNQPRMKLAKSDDPKVFKFVYFDGTSMDSAKDPHMHQLTMTLVEKNKITHEWVFFAGGEEQFTVRMDLTRKE